MLIAPCPTEAKKVNRLGVKGFQFVQFERGNKLFYKVTFLLERYIEEETLRKLKWREHGQILKLEKSVQIEQIKDVR